ncbi:16S rRNA processing protein RimM [Thermosulfidibacter takaii ABI70S6]|uniref:Ribosome maturation factor RimM n=1 Tax=Thermosulfidibacter takaii (strain DSM 17441 / JCM 13301 / NBRC 103674 / ABI70S6) TaxID=1298851 RepID=A0A0S3QSD8_THET7|nr:ribosome maturation factor RimM [Thermosulfidibacter takaii]BAT71201.1 16S rRNA processing protein RimM [Thermosulfidibacter takaii ABI70S6]
MKKEGFAIVSKILGPFGVQGEAKCSIETDILENITQQKGFYLRKGNRRIYMEVEYIKPHHRSFIIKFKGLETPEAVKYFKGWFLEVAYEDLVPLEEGEYYWFELIGLKAFTREGEFVGVVEDIIATGAHDVYVIRSEDKEILIPSVFAEKIDTEEEIMIINPIEGLL